MKKIQIKSPATVANLSCGYDILGLCLNEPFDYIEIEKITSSEVEIDILPSCFSDVPSNPELNTGGVPAIQIIKDLKLDFGFNIKIKKGIPLCGGLGSSAATAAGVVYGINKILNDALSFESPFAWPQNHCAFFRWPSCAFLFLISWTLVLSYRLWWKV